MIHLVYYSPALSTRKVARLIGKSVQENIKEYDITQKHTDLNVEADDLALFAVPVFAGRVPALAAEALSKIRGSNTPAIIVCVYGNREYEDALLELKNIVRANGFVPIAGGAFVAQHSIFPNVGANRPDEADRMKIEEFGKMCLDEYKKYKSENVSKDLQVKGNFPYRDPSVIPMFPDGDSRCDNCGICVKLCPVDAIPNDNPCDTEKELCISCARCVAVCPQHSRAFRGEFYESVREKFEMNFAGRRKEPEIFF